MVLLVHGYLEQKLKKNLKKTKKSSGGPDATGHVACDTCPAGSYSREYTWDMVNGGGDCQGPEIRVYEGADNPGNSDAQKLSACARACLAKKDPLNDVSWVSLFCNTCH